LKEQASAALDGRFLKSLEKFLAQYQGGFDIDRVSDFFTREDLPVKKSAELPDSVYRLWADIRSHLKTLCEEEALTAFDPYIEIFQHIKADFELKARKDDLLFLEELNKKAKSLFDEGAVTVEELYYRLATRFHHYLLDEFQDTSLLQWSNLKMMVEEALSTGGSLFYVGDKKQAIYGFRGGEIQLFDGIQQQFSHFNVCQEQLANNYRSQQAIVEFNNRIFSIENLRRFIAAKEEFEEDKKKTPVVFTEGEFQMLENVYGSSRQSHSPGREAGVVRVEIVVSDRKEDRDELIREMVVGRIEDAQRRFPLKDIALLTRSNDEIELLTRWLTEAGIPVQSERTVNIRENALVQDLIFLLKFLHSPIDNCAFARFIFGDLFSACVRDKDVYQKYLLETRTKMAAEKDFVLYRDFRGRFPRVWDDMFDEFFRQAGLYPLYELMISILRRFDVFVHFPGQQGFVMRFLELIKEEEENYTDAGSFLEKFDDMEEEKLYVHMTDAEAVKILTIHKAKGLEFPVVVIPFLGMRIKIGAGGGVGQVSYVLDFKEQNLRLMRIKEKYLKYSGPLYDIWREEYVRAFLFELNSIYVALTRASEELYVFVPNKTGTGFNPAQFLFPEECMQTGEAARRDRKASRKGPRLLLPPPVYQDWLAYLKDEFLDGDKVLRRQAVLRGDIAHAVLSFIDNLEGENVEESVGLALRQARALYPQIGEGREYQTLVCRFVSDEQIRPFFYIKEGDVCREWETVDRQGQTRRIDRLILGSQEIWVADFKSSREPATDYFQQVRAYMHIVRELFPGKVVRGFLLYIDTCAAEEVFLNETAGF
ncbi:MAG: 3'-5' exonuclease, partial [Candidatus Omnitrophota bacterium]|jgi:ATP-dependent exoDNAse (exonuclease V) beta subunit